MFNQDLNVPRQTLTHVQQTLEPFLVALNATNPHDGGPGLSAEQLHAGLGIALAGVSNLALALGAVIDVIDERLEHNGDTQANL